MSLFPYPVSYTHLDVYKRQMLDAAMTGSFSETNFDESRLSALETKFAHYLSAAEASSQNIAQEKDKIKTLIADISHQTKTPIANPVSYTHLDVYKRQSSYAAYFRSLSRWASKLYPSTCIEVDTLV